MSTSDLAAALNECMPLTIDGETYTLATVSGLTGAIRLRGTDHRLRQVNDDEIIGILWAECVRRGWTVTMEGGVEVCVHSHNHTFYATSTDTDALAFARAFAAAKRAEGGA